jgi:pantoate--beta-alanine ligase
VRIIQSAAAMQRQALVWKRSGRKVGLVPTMGYLHAGHIGLVHEARKRIGRDGILVVSIYVNPTQFGPAEDLSRYPRDWNRDRRLCREAGTDAVFLPTDDEMYPGKAEGRYSTYVVEESLSQGMEGASRPTHFRGVTTIVAKLFNLVLPDVSVFGAKDWQQAAVVRRMVLDLNFPVKIVVAPTTREADGLALSSRNKYLDPTERAEATVLSRALHHAAGLVAKKPATAAALRRRVERFVAQHSGGRLDYVAFFDPDSLEPSKRVDPGTQMALAVYFGKTRLIDNARL